MKNIKVSELKKNTSQIITDLPFTGPVFIVSKKDAIQGVLIPMEDYVKYVLLKKQS